MTTFELLARCLSPDFRLSFQQAPNLIKHHVTYLVRFQDGWHHDDFKSPWAIVVAEDFAQCRATYIRILSEVRNIQRYMEIAHLHITLEQAHEFMSMARRRETALKQMQYHMNEWGRI
jgi:hypothetical protein